MAGNYIQYPFKEGQIPRNWVETVVGEILLELQGGFSSGRHNQAGVGIPHLRPMNVSPEGEIAMDDVRYISPNVGELRLKRNDVLFTNTSSTAWVGKTALVRKPKEWAFSNHMTRLRVANGIDPEFVARQLHYLCTSGYFAFHCTKHINQSSISGQQLSSGVPFRLPPKEEQKRITRKLSRLIQKERRITNVLAEVASFIREYRTTVLQSAIRGRLIPTDSSLATKGGYHFEPARVLLEKIRTKKARLIRKGKSKASSFDFRVKSNEAPWHLPRGWSWCRLGEIIDLVSGQHIITRNYNRNGIGIPYITGPADFGKDHPIITKWTKEPKVKAIKNDILVTVKGAGLGKLNIVNTKELSISRQLMAIRPITVSAAYIFRFLQFRYEDLQRSGSGIAVPGLSREDITALLVPLPPLKEQKRIAREMARRFRIVTKIEVELQSARIQGRDLRKSIIHSAVAGKLTQQIRGDQPANVLLDKVKKDVLRQKALKRKEPRKRMKLAKGESVKLDLLEVLSKYPDGLTPDQLLEVAGYSLNEVPAFYKQLRAIESKIQEERPSPKTVILKKR